MDPQQSAAFVREHSTPQPLDVEMARGIIVQHLGSMGEGVTTHEQLVERVRQSLFPGMGPLPDTILAIRPDLNEAKSNLTAGEALQTLQATGAVVGY